MASKPLKIGLSESDRSSPTNHSRCEAVSALRAVRFFDPALAAEYLSEAAEDGDPRVYLAALRPVAEAKGMAKLAKAGGVPRESLYRALSSSGNPPIFNVARSSESRGTEDGH